MYVNRIRDLFSILGEGVWKEGRKEMKNCERVSANRLPGPFLDYKKESLPKIQWRQSW